MTTIAQTNSNVTTNNGGVTSKGISLTATQQNVTFSTCTFYLTNSTTGLTGTISVKILSSDGSTIGTLGTLDASTLPTDGNQYPYEFNTTPITTDSTNCFIGLFVPSGIANDVQFNYSTSPSTTDYIGFYQINPDDTPVTISQPYFRFSATYGGSSGSSGLLNPPPYSEVRF